MFRAICLVLGVTIVCAVLPGCISIPIAEDDEGDRIVYRSRDGFEVIDGSGRTLHRQNARDEQARQRARETQRLLDALEDDREAR